MFNHFAQLAEHVLEKADDQVSQLNELTYMKNEFESKVLESHTVIDTMEEAANAFEQRINHLEAES